MPTKRLLPTRIHWATSLRWLLILPIRKLFTPPPARRKALRCLFRATPEEVGATDGVAGCSAAYLGGSEFRTDNRSIFLASPHGVTVSVSGVRTVPLPAAVSDVSLGFASGTQPTIYATSEQGIFVSIDGGANWHKSELPGNSSKSARRRDQLSSSGDGLRFL